MGTAERRLAIMKYLCQKRYVTMLELAEEFGVSVRTVQRDVFELTFLMPLYVKPGRYGGGVYVAETYSMDRMYMSGKETALLGKVKKLVGNQLTEEELSVLDGILTRYTKKLSKNFFNVDSSCPG